MTMPFGFERPVASGTIFDPGRGVVSRTAPPGLGFVGVGRLREEEALDVARDAGRIAELECHRVRSPARFGGRHDLPTGKPVEVLRIGRQRRDSIANSLRDDRRLTAVLVLLHDPRDRRRARRIELHVLGPKDPVVVERERRRSGKSATRRRVEHHHRPAPLRDAGDDALLVLDPVDECVVGDERGGRVLRLGEHGDRDVRPCGSCIGGWARVEVDARDRRRRIDGRGSGGGARLRGRGGAASCHTRAWRERPRRRRLSRKRTIEDPYLPPSERGGRTLSVGVCFRELPAVANNATVPQMRVRGTGWLVVAALVGACGANQGVEPTARSSDGSPCALTPAELAAPAVSTANYDPTPPPSASH